MGIYLRQSFDGLTPSALAKADIKNPTEYVFIIAKCRRVVKTKNVENPIIMTEPAPLLKALCLKKSRGGSGRFYDSLELFDQSGDYFEKVTDNAVIGKFEDRGIRVFVDGDNNIRRGHSG